MPDVIYPDPAADRVLLLGDTGEPGTLVLQSKRLSDLVSRHSHPVQPALRGAWHAPDASGQGLFLDVGEGVAAVYGAWFTYGLAGGHKASEQRWYSLQGLTAASDTKGSYLPAAGKNRPGRRV